MATGDEKADYLGMSDDDFLNVNPAALEEGASAPSATLADDPKVDDEPATPAADVDAPAAGADDEPTEAEKAAAAEAEDDPAAKKDDDEDNPLNKSDAETGDKPEDAPKADDAKAKPDEGKDAPKDKVDPAAEPAKVDAPTPVTKVLTTPEEFKGFYEQVMKPFKANGREIKLRSPDEAIRLMQMGAGYGRKLQDLQPALKSLRMLEKNNLLDDTKLSYLIDLDKKNPDAIKKLIKDSGIDPLDLNMDDNASYRPTNHSVSDTEVSFANAVKDVSALPGGKETIQHIETTWDKKSKQFVWDQPEMLAVIQEQRQNGIYDAVSAEIDRLKMLGDIPPNAPFLEAYKIAGDALVKANSLPATEAAPADTTKKAPTPVVQPKADQPDSRVLATRVAAPKSQATNNDKAKAAAAPTAGGKKAKTTVNPLDMADDDFLKQFPL